MTPDDLRIEPRSSRPRSRPIASCATPSAGCWAASPTSTTRDRIAPEKMPELKRLMLHRLVEIDAPVRTRLCGCDYKRIFAALSAFMTVDLFGLLLRHSQGHALLRGIDVRRKYNAFDQIIEEEFKDEIGTYHLRYSYDKMGRRTRVELPDGSSISYTYDAFFPRSVSRCSKTGEILHTHSYNTYDQRGHLEEIFRLLEG